MTSQNRLSRRTFLLLNVQASQEQEAVRVFRVHLQQPSQRLLRLRVSLIEQQPIDLLLQFGAVIANCETSRNLPWPSLINSCGRCA